MTTAWTRILLAGLFCGCSGCVTVQAPDKPIVIELNINIRQEVIYRLDEKARNVIEQDSGIF